MQVILLTIAIVGFYNYSQYLWYKLTKNKTVFIPALNNLAKFDLLSWPSKAGVAVAIYNLVSGLIFLFVDIKTGLFMLVISALVSSYIAFRLTNFLISFLPIVGPVIALSLHISKNNSVTADLKPIQNTSQNYKQKAIPNPSSITSELAKSPIIQNTKYDTNKHLKANNNSFVTPPTPSHKTSSKLASTQSFSQPAIPSQNNKNPTNAAPAQGPITTKTTKYKQSETINPLDRKPKTYTFSYTPKNTPTLYKSYSTNIQNPTIQPNSNLSNISTNANHSTHKNTLDRFTADSSSRQAAN